jgi:hypothetical protein
MAGAALAPVHAITVSSELAPPVLQRGEAYAQQQGQLIGSGTICHSLIEDP